MRRLLPFTLVLLYAQAAAAALPVVASTSIIADLVKNVGGSRVSLTTLVPRNADTHDFQPSTGDARAVSRARIVFLNGLGLEGWLDDTFRNSASQSTRFIELGKGIKPLVVDGAPDPHTWWDLRNTRNYVKQAAQALSQADPAGTATYRTNAAVYDKALAELDAWASKQFATVPAAKRKFVTNHESLGYLAGRYGLKVVGTVIPGIGTEREPSARELAALSDLVKREKVSVIFTENTLAPRLADTIADATGAKIAPPLYTDSLGSLGSPGDSFVKAFRYNVTTMVGALR
jgi:ABC-type Zn uptake system ZnuABC Zn-binding protein ZnuA